MTRHKRWGFIVLAAFAVLAVVVMIGLHFATQLLKSKVEQALGADSEIGEITVGWTALEIHQLRIKGPPGWPAPDTLRAQRIVIVPDLIGLLSSKIRVHRIIVDEGYISVLRARDGRLRLLPSLIETHAKGGAGQNDVAVPIVAIGTIELRDSVLEFFDATVRQPPHKLRLEQLQAEVGSLQVPDLSGRTKIKIDGVIKGVQRDGTLTIDGWTELADKNSEISTHLQHVDMKAFEPYLIKASETGVRRGTLDLDLKSTVRKNNLNAPGDLTLSDLELESSGGAFATFMGVPRNAIISALKNSKNQITVHFTLEGNLNDPHFSLNENLAMRMGSGIASTLGVSIEGLARGVGNAAHGVGSTVRKLFGS
jgi:uncharacterized protein involved in outer membrane biogenesis